MRKMLRRLTQSNSGVAMIEFAFAAPIFVVLVLSGLELTNLAVAQMRVSQMAMTVADNAGRVQAGIDEANIHEVMAGANVIGRSIDFQANGRIVLSSLEENGRTGSREGQTIRWQRCWGSLAVNPSYGRQGAGNNNASLKQGMGPTGRRMTAAAETAVMFVEVTYDYQPLVGTGFFAPPRIRYESAFNVRGRQNNTISNSQNLTRLLCP